MAEKKSKKTARVEVIRHGRDEMNLVEYPFASLWKNTEPGAEIIHEWETQHPITGKTVQAFWRVTGDSELGLPTSRDEQLYLVLMELTQEADLENQTVYFTRHDLLKRLGWPHNESGYDLLEKAFTRMGAVFITSKNAFWDAKARSFKTVGFNLIDNFEIFNEKPGRRKAGQSELPLSFFKWNDVLFQSFQEGYIRAIDLDFALSLKGSLALRLYRYLDKKSYHGRRTFEIELAALCERHLGMRPNPYPSKYKERLAPAHEELIARGFLTSVDYKAMSTKKSEKVCYVFALRQNRTLPTVQKASPSTVNPVTVNPVTVNPVTEDQQKRVRPMGSSATGSRDAAASSAPSQASSFSEPSGALESNLFLGVEQSKSGQQESTDLLLRIRELGVSADVARDLAQNTELETLQLHLDCLADRTPQDAAAVFVKAVREDWAPPARYFERQKAAERAQKAQEAAEAAQRRQAAEEAAMLQEQSVLEQELTALNTIWDKLDERTRERLEQQVRKELEKNEFLRARLQAGKLTPQSPDWMQARHLVLREMLDKVMD